MKYDKLGASAPTIPSLFFQNILQRPYYQKIQKSAIASANLQQRASGQQPFSNWFPKNRQPM